jgi:exopolyphosphatase/guanosine-5'-triphosphate,3'-diphosphate pyrophosphatase
MARFDPRELLTSAYGIREGLLLEAARVTPTVADPGKARERSVREFAERCHYEEPHARQVQLLSLQLFDVLAPRMGLTDDDRRILADAALLHDVGYHINYEKHHKHSFHLISHGAAPKLKHVGFGRLDRSTRDRIVKLSALLRFADGMDRGHVGAVAGMRVKWTSNEVRVTALEAKGATNVRLECWGASRKRRLLEEVLDRPIVVMTPDGVTISADDDGDGE